MISQVIYLILLIIITIIFAIDIVPVFITWLSRINIGRYDNRKIWAKSVTTIGVKWVGKTPKIQVTDNTRLVIVDMLKGKYSKDTIQHWQEAALVLGLSEYIKHHDDQEIINQIRKFLNSKFDSIGNWRTNPVHVDASIIAYSLMKLEFIDLDKYKNALDKTWEMIQEHIGEDGTVQYRKSMKSYRYVDTIGFICPFLVAYGTKYNKPECIELAVKQIQEYELYGMLQNHYIPSHAYKHDNKVPLGLYGWGRGLGWFAIGVVDAWDELSEDHHYKLVLKDIVRKFAVAAMKLQQNNGSWNWTVTREECRPDSSATATLGWLMLKASTISEISKECLDSTEKAVSYLMKVTRRNGAIDFSQGDTKDIGVYSVLFNTLPFTQGFCIRVSSLLLQYQGVEITYDSKNSILSEGKDSKVFA